MPEVKKRRIDGFLVRNADAARARPANHGVLETPKARPVSNDFPVLFFSVRAKYDFASLHAAVGARKFFASMPAKYDFASLLSAAGARKGIGKVFEQRFEWSFKCCRSLPNQTLILSCCFIQ